MSNSCYNNSFLLIPKQIYYQKRGVHMKKKIFKEILGNKKVIFINNTSWQIMTSIRDVGLVKVLNIYQNRDRRDGKSTCYHVWQPVEFDNLQELIYRAHMKEGKKHSHKLFTDLHRHMVVTVGHPSPNK